MKDAGTLRGKALPSDSSDRSGTKLCPLVTEKQLYVSKTELHPKLLPPVKQERSFNSCLDLSGQYYLFACIVLNANVQLRFFGGIYFTVRPKESASGAM